MNNLVQRVYVEKKSGFDVEAQNLFMDLKENLNIHSINSIRILNCYDISGLSKNEFLTSVNSIFAEKTVDNIYIEELPKKENEYVFATEYLPGQYDQRSDSAIQCIQLIIKGKRPIVHTSKVVLISGNITKDDSEKIKKYYINPVDSREAELFKPEKLEQEYDIPEKVEVLNEFITLDEASLKKLHQKLNLAMTIKDLSLCKDYFKNIEKRNPTITEIRVLDTYWSDHCRHTTFSTEIQSINIEGGEFSSPIEDSYELYKKCRESVNTGKVEKPITLMDLATLAAKDLKKKGLLINLDESDEINACSIKVPVNIDGVNENYLIMFKNETHNHPTEIEPFGGAATCLGGAIRDPLSGRAYVYQAMRVTGSGDPRKKLSETLPGKLSQKKITTEAAHGYSSYGNQIGLSTGMVTEIYDEGYIAKRMEIGAVIGAAPEKNVVRQIPAPGDIVVLLGGRTGRDGCGGATGSSKKHTEKSISECGAEVQKGNPPTERKIQRLFRREEVSTLIKRCNDFGAGGVSVAIGELADGLKINLDLVPKKYEGLDGTELAISESQERMAVVIAPENIEKFINFSTEENLEATVVAEVTNNNRLTMLWNDEVIVDIDRNFLNTNGAKSYTDVKINAPGKIDEYFKAEAEKNIKEKWFSVMEDLNVCSQKGLSERFDSTIGAGTVLMPFGGKYQLTPAEAMVCKVPVLKGNTSTSTIMSFGFNPQLAKLSPFHGALYAVVEAVSRVVAVGGNYKNIKLTFQEYFERLGESPERWGKPFASLLGAFYAQEALEIAAIGGKDSMSGSFNDLDVPPTLTAFAVDVIEDSHNVISQEFKNVDSRVILIKTPIDKNMLPDFQKLKENYIAINKMANNKLIKSCHTIRYGGICEAISKMCFGNKIGFSFNSSTFSEDLFSPLYGSFLLEVGNNIDLSKFIKEDSYLEIGSTQDKSYITINNIEMGLEDLIEKWRSPLEVVFPCETKEEKIAYTPNVYSKVEIQKSPTIKLVSPKVFIPVFPGTNCEYDSTRAFERAGGNVTTLVFKNNTSSDVEDSVTAMEKCIRNSQILMIPGGFSAGDEPEGSGKFIANVFRNPKLKDAVMDLIKNRDGLVLGICNGFQALIKLGLVPYGEILDIDENCPTLTYNNIGRHVSCMVNTKITSNLSPWFNNVNVGDIYKIPVSHGEGRFVAPKKVIESLLQNGQVATQYVDDDGNVTSSMPYNPNGSMFAIEGITSPDGRVLGKMGHSERIGENIHKNVPGLKDQKIFEAGINYFK
ncbi:phosphoribosylformylglycinamidine synthase [Clostridium sp. 19966]|uniref:phosphoribosylformylglycinamidine synthase n=1 Tax=Clostridium sp. 19966 TaxID=2768166 RepID=UPI0028E07440|nr:phosphoribosylformylglycinamidine synthase [Clostridium sp. 19966]MDT8716349.1 phosphoribosylformylglycinamidine synthase [Clostridium sp. 19966]